MIKKKNYHVLGFILLCCFGPATAFEDTELTAGPALTQSPQTVVKLASNPHIMKRLKKGLKAKNETAALPHCDGYATAIEIIFGTQACVGSNQNDAGQIDGLPTDLLPIVGSYLNQFMVKKSLRLDTPVSGLAIFNEGQTIAVGCTYHNVCLWDSNTNTAAQDPPKAAVKTIVTGQDYDNELGSITRISDTEFVMNTDESIDRLHKARDIPKKTIWSIKTSQSTGTLPCELNQTEIDLMYKSGIRSYEDTSYVNRISTSHDDIITACSTWGTVKQWHYERKQWQCVAEILRPDTKRATSIDGMLIFEGLRGGIEIYDAQNQKCAPLFLCKVPSEQVGYTHPQVEHSCISPSGEVIALAANNGNYFMMKFNPKNLTTSYLTANGWKQLCASITYFSVKDMYYSHFTTQLREQCPIIPQDDPLFIDGWHRITACAVLPKTNELVVTAVTGGSTDGHVFIFARPLGEKTTQEKTALETVEKKSTSDTNANHHAQYRDEEDDYYDDETEEILAITEVYPASDHWRRTIDLKPSMSARKALAYAACSGIGIVSLYKLFTKYRQSPR